MRWHKLSAQKNSTLWSGFTEEFSFSPSVTPDRWPSIRGGMSVQRFDVRLYAATSEEFAERAREIDKHLWDLIERYIEANPGTVLFALEWQHNGFEPELAPQSDSGSNRPIAIFPNGEYPLLMTDNGDFYMLGDPWEKSISLFGRSVPKLISSYLESTFPLMN